MHTNYAGNDMLFYILFCDSVGSFSEDFSFSCIVGRKYTNIYFKLNSIKSVIIKIGQKALVVNVKLFCSHIDFFLLSYFKVNSVAHT